MHIEWVREGRKVLLPVVVLAPFPVTDLSGVEATALLDTGSSVCGVASRLAATLGLSRLGKRPLTTAHGDGQIERYAFRIGLRADVGTDESGAFPFVFDEVIGIEMANAFEFDVLIGMDILSQCDFRMDRNGACRLAFGHA